MRIFKTLGLVIAVLTVAAQAPAQYRDFYGGNWNNGLSAFASTAIWNCVYYPLACKKSGGASKGKTASTAAAPSGRQTQPASTAYRSSLKFKFSGSFIKTGELANGLGNTPAERGHYHKLMDAVLVAFGQQATKAGFPNDIPAALSFFLGENMRIYRGLPELSDQQYIDLRNAIADAVVASGAISNMSDRQKQEMYETLVAYTGITQYGYEQGLQAHDDATIKGFQKVAGQNLQIVTKMSPETLTLP